MIFDVYLESFNATSLMVSVYEVLEVGRLCVSLGLKMSTSRKQKYSYIMAVMLVSLVLHIGACMLPVQLLCEC